jgi:3-hydroxyacyl-CoA dehydrogenase
VLYDVSTEVLDKSASRVKRELELQQCEADSEGTSSDAQKKPNAEDLLFCTDRIDDVGSCRVILETIPEKLRAKQKVYRAIEKIISPDAFLFTNTSTIEIDQLADAVPDAKRFCGFHFFHPVRKRSLVEIIRGKRTGMEILEVARRHALAIEKRPLLVRDGPGFLVNRLLNPYLSEAFALLGDGATLEQLERVPVEFGMWAGPLRIMDEIGLDVTLHAGSVLRKAFPERSVDSELLVEMVLARRLGRKVGRGFLLYDRDALWEKPGTIDPEVEEMVRTRLGKDSGRLRPDDEEVARRLIGAMLLEGARIIEDRITDRLEDCDRAVVFGLGFPGERGGLVHWYRRLTDLQRREYLDFLRPLGKRFEANDRICGWLEGRGPLVGASGDIPRPHAIMLERSSG